MLEGSEIQLLKTLCEQERAEIMTILMLSMENPRLLGFMLTENRSMFLSTDGSLAWLYHCPLMRSPQHVMNRWYDKSLSSTKLLSSLSTQSPDKPTQMPKFKIVLTEKRTSFNLTWKTRTLGSLLHTL